MMVLIALFRNERLQFTLDIASLSIECDAYFEIDENSRCN